MMNILALDPASKTGFAHFDGTHGVWNLGKAPDTHALRVWRLHEHIKDFVLNHPTDLIVHEEARFGGIHRQGAGLHFKLIGAINVYCSSYDVGLLDVSPRLIKFHATGSFVANKKHMIQACIDTFGIVPEDDNEADALWILSWAQEDIRKSLQGVGEGERP